MLAEQNGKKKNTQCSTLATAERSNVGNDSTSRARQKLVLLGRRRREQEDDCDVDQPSDAWQGHCMPGDVAEEEEDVEASLGRLGQSKLAWKPSLYSLASEDVSFARSSQRWQASNKSVRSLRDISKTRNPHESIRKLNW